LIFITVEGKRLKNYCNVTLASALKELNWKKTAHCMVGQLLGDSVPAFEDHLYNTHVRILPKNFNRRKII